MYLTVNYSIVTASGVKNGTAFANVNNSGVNWSVVANAQGSDNNYATSALTSSNRTSNYLQATGFGTAIVPTGATIAGIEVKLERTDRSNAQSFSFEK